jgi:hypothetical protein
MCQQMKNGIRLFTMVFTATIFVVSVLTESQAQKRAATFSHSTPAHKQGKLKDCSVCHTLPTANWKSPRQDKADPFPDVVTFPYAKHMICNGCHSSGAKPDIFSNGGAFCGSCHVSASMRATGGKGVLPFPVRSRAKQFTTRFPHNVHQDIIATHRARVSSLAFLAASFPGAAYNGTQVSSCSMCHKTSTELPKFSARIPSGVKQLANAVSDAGTPNFPPVAGFFKDSPTNHASCFTCHYQGVKPLGAECAGCHVPAAPSPGAAVVKRFSLRFNHQQSDHSKADCISCHIGIAQNADLRSMIGADVPIVACLSCHTSAHAQDLADELAQREQSVADKKPAFQCIYCHTSAVGRFPAPRSHEIR